jgi:hypothetical protein
MSVKLTIYLDKKMLDTLIKDKIVAAGELKMLGDISVDVEVALDESKDQEPTK